MLETKGLTKIYKPKRGVPVEALKGVSLKFPDKGMVFLIGKSGSGKSTLLNLLGGLDRYDGGEIIIKGVSSKSFNQTSFDSYRNTYVGFIFQEYNILEEFNVGANIALALELQGKRATDEEINRILAEVDLTGYGSRKPNELSGGQLQRVAIARALVKNPEIIMADEPTGALDSRTGAQVLDTLKRLSETKLVIVVSHDIDYAQCYADRIIELSDGRVICDIENDPTASDIRELTYDGETITIPAEYHLTEADREEINAYIDQIKTGVSLKLASARRKFRPTAVESIVNDRSSPFRLIGSKLPIKFAAKMGAEGLKRKKIRLAFTIILSVIAFSLFGIVDTFSSYDHTTAAVDSIIDSGVSYVSVVKSVLESYYDTDYWYSYGYMLSDDDLDTFEEATGVNMTGVVVNPQETLTLGSNTNTESELYTENMTFIVHSFGFSGFADITSETLEGYGYTLAAGALPDGNKNEIAITDYIFDTFRLGGYSDAQNPVLDEEGNVVYETISSYEDIVGKTLLLADVEYTISGVIETNFDFDRYSVILGDSTLWDTADMITYYVLYSEASYMSSYGPYAVAFVGEGKAEEICKSFPETYSVNGAFWITKDDEGSGIYFDTYFSRIGTLEMIEDTSVVTWLGDEKTSLDDGEIIITSDAWNEYSTVASDEMGIYYDNGISVDDAVSILTGTTFENEFLNEDPSTFYYFYSNLYDEGGNYGTEEGGYIDLGDIKVVGIIDVSEHPEYALSAVYTSDTIFNYCVSEHQMGPYSFAIGNMPKSESAIKTLVEYCYPTGDDVTLRYEMQNSAVYELDAVDEVFETLSSVFMGIGIAMALFSAAMLANYIGTSIAYKKQEIGILRAIGARSADVFRIFFSESFIIAAINFLISFTGTFIITAAINYVLREYVGILVTVLSCGMRQFIILFVISVGIAAIASFIPVYSIASKRPIDAIRNR
ncbi:MAG: ABC transporter ATP-binding protein/permease [Clostridia bacterium]|nr:ABC transporter ATP-binding protein/permease [Clostridia bacterium]